MKLCNLKVIAAPHLLTEPLRNVRINAHRDDEGAHRCSPLFSSDASSMASSPERAISDSAGADCLHLNHECHKWSRDENIELMRWFYLAKQDGRGYRNHLKSLWDSRNPSKAFMSVNTLCCHACNVQTAEMLTTYELTKLEESSSSMLPVTDPTSFVPSDGHVSLLATPSALGADSLPSDSLAAGESVVSGNVPVSSCVSIDDSDLKDNLLPLLSSSPVFQGDVAVLEMLIDQFKDLD